GRGGVRAGGRWTRTGPADMTRWYEGLAVMGGMLGAWVVLGLASRKLRKGTPAEAGVHHGDDSGRSIAVLGGGIGAVCGQWLVDRWSHRRQPRPVPPPIPPQGMPPGPDKGA